MALNLEDVKKMLDAEVNGKKQKDEKYVDVADEAITRVRILPPKDSKNFYLKSGYHVIEEKFYTCPKYTNGSRCPICDKVSKLYRSKDPADIELARSLKARKRFYFNAIDRSVEEKGPKILITGIKLFQKILDSICNVEIGDITDPETGYDFLINKTKIGDFWNYDKSEVSRKTSKLSTDPEKAKQWIANQYDLAAQVTIPEYDELAEALANFLAYDNSTVDAAKKIVENKNTVMPSSVVEQAKSAMMNKPATTTTPAAAPVTETSAAPEDDDKDMSDFIANLNKLKEEMNGESK